VTTIDAGNWAAVVDAAHLTGMARQLALNCSPAGFQDGVLRLHFDEAAAHQRTRATEDKLVQALSQHLGREVRVLFQAPDAEVVTPARQRTLAEQDKAARAAAAFADDPTVKGLRERFGAEIDTAGKPTH
jgi:hypothetical protein